MLQVESLMLALILVSAVRAHDEFDTAATSTWVFLIGFVSVFAGALTLILMMDRRATATSPAPLAHA
jgi:hypothetical protein